MNYFTEKLPAECDVESGLRSLSEVPTNGDHYLNYFANPSRKQIDTHYLAVNFLKNQNYAEKWSSQTARRPHTLGNILFYVENENNALKLIIQSGHNLLHAEDTEKKEISYSKNTANAIVENTIPNELKSEYLENSTDTAEGDVSESTNNQSDEYNWLKVLGIFCNLCDRVFPSKVDIDDHFKIAHLGNKISYTCSECKKNFEIYHRFRNHCYRHIIGGRYKCADCTRSYSRRSQLLEHKKAFHSENSQPDSKPFTCEQCGESFITKSRLSCHARWHQNDGQTQYTCQECGKVLHTGGGLAAHMAAHKEGRQFMCHLCGMSFVQKVNLQVHVKRHKGLHRFQCAFCPRFFPCHSALANHIAFHANGRQFECPACRKLYKTERDLKVHSLVHADRRPFICNDCGKGFLTSSKLKQHSNIHTGERPYRCQYCQMTFTNFPNLIKHTRKKHKVHHKTGMPLDCKDVPGKDAAQSVISTLDDSTMSVINNYAVIASYKGSPSVASSSEEFGHSSMSDAEKPMHFIPTDPAEDLEYFTKETAAWKKNQIKTDICRDDRELSNVDTESVVSMDLSDNSVLLYNERMENADDVLNCTFLDMNDFDVPNVQQCTTESNLQLDQTDLLPHNGWQKVNMQDVTVDIEKQKNIVPIEENSPDTDLNYAYVDVVNSSKDTELEKLLDFMSGGGAVDFVKDVNQFVNETALHENIQDQMLELNHSYIKEQIEGFSSKSEKNSLNKPYNDANSNIYVGDVSNSQQLQPAAELCHLRPKYVNYPMAGVSPAALYDNAEEISSKHSTKLPRDVFELNENNAANDSNVSPLYGGDFSLTISNNDDLTADGNLSTSPIIIFNANDLKHDTEPNAGFKFSADTLSAAESPMETNIPDNNIDIPQKVDLERPVDDSIYQQSLDSLTSANLNLIEEIYNSNPSRRELYRKNFDSDEIKQSEVSNDSPDIDSHLDVMDTVNSLQYNGSYLNDLYLSAQMLTHPLILDEKLRNNDLMFTVHPMLHR